MRLAIAVAIGLASGVLSGAFGIGGAILTTPGIRLLLGTSALVAVGTPLPVIIPTAAVGVYTYSRSGLVEMRMAAVAAAAGGVFAVLGALTTRYVRGEALLIVTAVLMLVLAVRMLPRKTVVKPPRITPGVPAFLAVGAVSGFVSGLLGVGGGIILVPVFTTILQLPVKTALGTSLAVIAAQAIPGTVVHTALHHIDWTIAGGLTIGVVPGARIGSRLGVAAEEEVLRIVVALGMIALAGLLGANEIRALLR